MVNVPEAAAARSTEAHTSVAPALDNGLEKPYSCVMKDDPAATLTVTPEEVLGQRLALALSALLYPMIGLAIQKSNPGMFDPLAARVALGVLALSSVAASWRGWIGAEGFQRAVFVVASGYLVHLLSIEWVNGLPLVYYGGIALIIFLGMLLQSSPQAIAAYALLAVFGSATVALTAADAQSSRARFAMALGGFAVMAAGISARRVALVRALDERDRSLTAALAERERLARIIEASTDFIAMANAGGRLAFVNPAAKRLLGLPPDAPLRAVFDRVDPAGIEHLRAHVIPAIWSGQNWEGELHFRHVDGHELSLEAYVFPLRDDAGRWSAGAVLRDVTERQALDRLRDEFVSTVTHELRTPLSAILGAVALLDEPTAVAAPPTHTRLLDIIRANAQRLTRLIQDILDLQRLRVGGEGLRARPVQVASVVQAATSALGALAEQRGLRFALELDPGARAVSADADRIAQVLTNLLSNALRFGPAGSQVEVRVAPHGAEFARFEVRDHGPGVPEGTAPLLFQPFRQVGAVAAAGGRGEGSGLGLAISRAIVERHGGLIGYDRGPEGPSVFWFTLPLVTSAPRGRERLRVLVASDDALQALDWVEALRSEGFDARAVARREELERELEVGGWHLLVFDLGGCTLADLAPWLHAPGAPDVIEPGGTDAQPERRVLARARELDAALPRPALESGSRLA